MGKKVLIMGASGGIGKALVMTYLNQASTTEVVATARQTTTLPEHDRCTKHTLDITNEAAIKAFFQHFQTDFFDEIVIATGILCTSQAGPEKSLRDLAQPQLIEYFNVNTIGPILCAKYAVPYLKQSQRAILAILSARVGSISDNRLGGWYGYRASKAALNMMIKTLAIEMLRKSPKMMIVGLHPGTVDSALSKPFQSRVPQHQLFQPEYAAQQLVNILDTLDTTRTGTLIAWDGTTITP